MLRPLRTLFLVGMAFVAGLGVERHQNGERCGNAGGTMSAGLCIGATE